MPGAGSNPAAPAPSFAPPTPAAPPVEPQYGAGYTEQSAKLNYQVNNELAGDKLTFENATHNYEYQNQLREHISEPKAYTGLRRSGVAAGVSEAGFMGENRGQLAAGFAAQRLKGEEGIKGLQERENLAAGRSLENYSANLGTLGNREQDRYLKEQERLAPQTQAAPAGAAAAVAKAFPGGTPEQLKYAKEHSGYYTAPGAPLVSGVYGGVAQPSKAKRAQGGAVQAGRSYTVGERGPERFTPRQNGLISPLRAKAGKKAARR